MTQSNDTTTWAPGDSWDMAELDAMCAATQAVQDAGRAALLEKSRTRSLDLFNRARAAEASRPEASIVVQRAGSRGSLTTTTVGVAAPDRASGKQTALIERLVAERALPVEHAAWVAQVLATGLTGHQASAIIDRLLALPMRATAAPADMPEVPAGRYAVPNADGELRFYVVDRPGDDSRWAGRTFLSVLASNEKHAVRGTAARSILATIAEDAEGAMLRYGQEVGRCGHCNRLLTDADSRARGIGPICAGRMAG
jgi:uncharacterized protein DUF6011